MDESVGTIYNGYLIVTPELKVYHNDKLLISIMQGQANSVSKQTPAPC